MQSEALFGLDAFALFIGSVGLLGILALAYMAGVIAGIAYHARLMSGIPESQPLTEEHHPYSITWDDFGEGTYILPDENKDGTDKWGFLYE